MRWLKRDFIIKFSTIVTVFMTVLVSMNLLELLDKYVRISFEITSTSEYEYQELREIRYKENGLWENESCATNDEINERLDNIKKDIMCFFEELPSFEGNITIPLVYIRLNDGIEVNCNVIISFNEKIPYSISQVTEKTYGVYIGNSYNGYWNGNKIKLNTEVFDVAGVIRSDYLQLDNTLIIPYLGMNEIAKENLVDVIANDVLYENSLPLVFSSNIKNVVNNDMTKMAEYIGADGKLFLKEINSEQKEELAKAETDTLLIYSIIKQAVCIISGIFCFIAIFESFRLFLNRKKKDIAIMWSLGLSKLIIYKKLITELGLSIIIGIVLAFVLEWGIYVVILDYRAKIVFRYGVYALAFVIFAGFLMMIGITNRLIMKGKVNEERV